MRRKLSDKQRRAMFARLNSKDYASIARRTGLKGVQATHYKKFMLLRFPKEFDENYAKEWAVRFKKNPYPYMDKQSVKVMQVIRSSQDTDKDGVKDKKDCKPYDSKEQGWLHDLNMKRLKAKEESLEKKREKEQRKLEDLKDELKGRRAISQKGVKAKQAMLKQKQAVIDELKREKAETKKIKKLEAQAKKELDKYTWTGKVKKGAAYAGSRIALGAKKFKEDWEDPKNIKRRQKAAKTTGKVLKKIWRKIG